MTDCRLRWRNAQVAEHRKANFLHQEVTREAVGLRCAPADTPMELERSAPMLDVGFAWSDGGDGAGADRAQGATGSSPTDRKICSTVSELSMSSSLSRFSGWRSRSLSLGEGLTDSTGARDGTRADGVLDRGRRRLFSFWRYCLAAPSSYRVDRGRHLASSTFGGVDRCKRIDLLYYNHLPRTYLWKRSC